MLRQACRHAVHHATGTGSGRCRYQRSRTPYSLPCPEKDITPVNGVHDEMIPVSNSFRLVENLPNAVLLVYPDSGHGSLFQFHDSFTRHASAFLSSESAFAPY